MLPEREGEGRSVASRLDNALHELDILPVCSVSVTLRQMSDVLTELVLLL